MASVVIHNLSKSFFDRSGRTVSAVDRMDLEIRDREFMVLVGPSGCGKSTTLRMIAGLDEVSEGTIAIDGLVVNRLPPQHRDVAMVFQNYALLPHLSAYDNMAFGLKVRRMPKPEIDRRVRQAAAILGLEAELDRRPAALSGGQCQRVAVGRAIVRHASVFLFDEPLSNLDAKMRLSMRSEILKLHRLLGATTVYVTHDQVEAMTMGDRICVMREGRIMQVARPFEIYARPANTFVAGFIGSPPMNFVSGYLRLIGGAVTFQSADGAIPLRFAVPSDLAGAATPGIDRPAVWAIRPEAVGEAGAAPSGLPRVTGSIEGVESVGAEAYVQVKVGGLALVARVPPSDKYAPGQRIDLAVDISRAHLFDPESGERIGP